MTAASAASAERYSSSEYLATYLHAEWGDLLFPCTEPIDGGTDITDEDRGKRDGNPGLFYRHIGCLARAWTSRTPMPCRHICDIGGSTGRMSYELAFHFPGATDRLLIEPSATFCTWARRLLLGDKFDGWIPIPLHIGQTGFRHIDKSNLPTPVHALSVHCVSAASIPRPSNYFDLITCLNVVDRVRHPAHLTQTACRLLRPGGMLILASPLHFEERFTKRNRWITDLHEILDPRIWAIDGREEEVPYEFKHYRRRFSLYLSQAVGAIKLKDC